ncbi:MULTISPECIES: hypothetical protein [unclassified Synechococcus]|uniref:hypothetical protein n=1 Tax=unclassified Synechococcus TaxID=2626047 RepID=UPI0020CDFBA8|nr:MULTISPECIES: hypothetical protein [unclassified Synechococcus]
MPATLGLRGQGLPQISPAVFQVFFMIDVAGKQEYLLHSPHGFMKTVVGFELIVV